MAGYNIDKDRKVIPRWRTFGKSLRSKEFGSVVPPRTRQKITTDFLTQKSMDWQKHQTVGHAADFVGAALTLDREWEAISAARFLLRDDLKVSPWARELAEQVLTSPDIAENAELRPVAVERSDLEGNVRNLKQLLRTEPRDPITWVELSRVYAILNHRKQAERSMTVAVQLAKNNRFVLRAASRLWVHLGEPDKAHDIIARADRTRHDPWLLAAEIAIGSITGKRPQFVKIAKKMLTGGKFSQAHVSELASAVATLELASGSIRNSKRLFKLSLADPTENSIAQAAWASRQSDAIRLEDNYLAFPNVFEAKAWVSRQKGHWVDAIEQSRLWLFDQPFSSRPSGQGSYIAAVALEDYKRCIWFAESGLRANPNDFTLLNNLAFARINLGDIKGAMKELSHIDRLQLSDQRERAVLQATKGLLAFRTGKIERGRDLYSEARLIARSKDNSDSSMLALTYVFQAFEEIPKEGSDSSPVVREAFRAVKREYDPIFRVLEDRLTKMASSKSARPEELNRLHRC